MQFGRGSELYAIAANDFTLGHSRFDPRGLASYR
jgi:hypothetical protein